jgi:peptidoglycan hydrolase CwlO-like protein
MSATNPDFGMSPVTPAVEPLSLRLPRDLLVLQPLQGHLDVEPVLLAPGLRCVIGSAEGCAVRLTKSTLVRPEHCTIEVSGRQTLLTKWASETTWLNDRLVAEPCELVSGDRIAIGPFDFQVRPASADELLYAKLVERDSGEPNNVDDVLRLKRAINGSAREKNANATGSGGEPALGLISELLREANDGSESDTHDRLTQHISKLLGDLQSQVQALHEREAELNEQLRSQRGPITPVELGTETPAIVPVAVRSEYDQVLQLLKSERDELNQGREQLEKDRQKLVAEQTLWRQQQQDQRKQLETLQIQTAELEAEWQAVADKRQVCQTLAAELMRNEARLAEWEDRLRREELERTALRSEPPARDQTPSPDPASRSTIEPSPAAAISKPDVPTPSSWINQPASGVELESPLPSGRPTQTLLTLGALSLAAFLLAGAFGAHEVNTTIGWGTAIVGAASTVDLLIRRCLSGRR